MDIALARRVEARLAAEAASSTACAGRRWCRQCRVAKERLLAGEAERRRCRSPGAAAASSAARSPPRSTRAEVETLVLRRLLPARRRRRAPARQRAAGSPRVGPAVRGRVGDPAPPRRVPRAARTRRSAPRDAVLFNGGVFTPAVLRERVTAVLAAWAGGARARPCSPSVGSTSPSRAAPPTTGSRAAATACASAAAARAPTTSGSAPADDAGARAPALPRAARHGRGRDGRRCASPSSRCSRIGR